jgi:hypothetical protein
LLWLANILITVTTAVGDNVVTAGIEYHGSGIERSVRQQRIPSRVFARRHMKE